ncbi:hypothetical protein ASG63_22345 [Methylobacterium sp. Leaf94]|nr:hypothetical protein ASG63_22345 [Methylobacterium sp. Leaf94]
MIVKASGRTQVWLVTHSERLADAILAEGGAHAHRVIKREGATWIEGLKLSLALSPRRTEGGRPPAVSPCRG